MRVRSLAVTRLLDGEVSRSPREFLRLLPGHPLGSTFELVTIYPFKRLPDRGVACWAALGVVASAGLVACWRPAFEIGLSAYIGAGEDQRGFDYERELTPLTNLRPWSLLIVAAAMLLLVTSVAALVWGNRPILVFLACGIALLSLRAALDVDDRLVWSEGSGVIGYDEPSGGPLLQPAINELKVDDTPFPGGPGPAAGNCWAARTAYRARGLDAWWLLLRLAVVASLLAAFRAFRLSPASMASPGTNFGRGTRGARMAHRPRPQRARMRPR